MSPFNVELLIRDNFLNSKSFIKIFNFQNKKQNSIHKIKLGVITLIGIDGMFVETSPEFEDAFALLAMAMSSKPNVGPFCAEQ